VILILLIVIVTLISTLINNLHTFLIEIYLANLLSCYYNLLELIKYDMSYKAKIYVLISCF